MNNETEPNKQYSRCLVLWNQLNSKVNETTKLFEGSVITEGVAAGLPVSAVSATLGHLDRLGAVEVIQRGNGVQQSVVRLLTNPKTLQWTTPEGLTPRPRDGKLSRQLREIAKQLGGMNVPEALAGFDTRLSLLEKNVSALRQLIKDMNGEAT